MKALMATLCKDIDVAASPTPPCRAPAVLLDMPANWCRLLLLLCLLIINTLPLTSAAGHRRAASLATHPREYYLGAHYNTSRGASSLFADPSQSGSCGEGTCGPALSFTGRGVHVAVLDTGLCAGFAAHSRNPVTCTSVVPNVACEDEGCGHGTRSVSVLAGNVDLHCGLTSTAGSSPASGVATPNCSSAAPLETLFSRYHYVGMAPRATVRVFRVFDKAGRTRLRYLTRALDLLLEDAAQHNHRQTRTDSAAAAGMKESLRTPPAPADIVSLSYGGEDYYGNEAVRQRLHVLMHHYGVSVVAAAGNDQYRFGSVRSPADMPGVLAVGAVRRTVPSNGGRKERPTTQRRRSTRNADVCDESHTRRDCMHRATVASFSGRGPSTWELPLGAGRVKPDLVALGQHVWAVERVVLPSTSPHLPSPSSAAPHLRIRSVTGTSIATPVVAGALALCVEAVRWTDAQRLQRHSAIISAHRGPSSPLRPPDNSDCNEALFWPTRVRTAIRARQAVLQTTARLEPPLPLLTAAAERQRGRCAPVTASTGVESCARNPPGNSSAASQPSREGGAYAGVVLARLYARYVGLMQYSIFSQGMGEVQPRRAVEYIVRGELRKARETAAVAEATCVSYAVPPFLRLGDAALTTAAAGSPTFANAASAHSFARVSDTLYWWPYTDTAVYPGAPPLLVNLSVALHCPTQASSFSTVPAAAGTAGASGEAAESAERRVRYQITKLTGHLPSHAQQHTNSSALNVVLVQRENGGISTAVHRWLKQRLLRVATHWQAVQAPQAHDNSSSASSHHPLLPPTAFTLSAAFHVPLAAHSRLRYCAPSSTRSVSSGHHARSLDADPQHSIREDIETVSSSSNEERRPGEERCVPLFHHFLSLEVEGELQIGHTRTTSSSDNATSFTLHHLIPFTIHVAAPPPRVQRVLIDTSLDWFNPTASGSPLFVAGDDPHAAATSDATRPSSYAEVNGDHPHSNLALLSVFLRHTLGLAVSAFPLLYAATTATSPFAHQREAASAAAEALKNSGTLLLIDPERPLTQSMRRLLTAAVQPPLAGSPTRRLNVVLITDWYSKEVAAGMRWLRDVQENSIEDDELTETPAPEELNATSSSAMPCSPPFDKDNAPELRAWWPSAANTSATAATAHPPHLRMQGLPGTCHVPSINRWLTDLTSAHRVVSLQRVESLSCSDVRQRASVLSPFLLSEDVVLDGVFMVSAANTAALTHNRSGSPSARSLGQLNAAGVLQWSSARTPPAGPALMASAAFPQSSPRGSATLCNVWPLYAAQQRRLRKRRRHTTAASGPTASEEDEDAWETLTSAADSVAKRQAAIARIVDVNLPTQPQSSMTPSPLTHGVLGFLSLPPSHESEPGRIAIFTDSNCLSGDDAHLQSTLAEVERLLRSSDPSCSLDVLTTLEVGHSTSSSPALETLFRKEATQGSACVEVVKELLHWVHHGDLQLWKTAAQLQCETRLWGAAPSQVANERCTANGTAPIVDHDGCDEQNGGHNTRGESPVQHSQQAAEEALDVAYTAPERLAVGHVVSGLWSTSVIPWYDESAGLRVESLPCTNGSVLLCEALNDADAPLSTSHTHDGIINESNAAAGLRPFAKAVASAQQAAEAAVRDALAIRYHGDWAAYRQQTGEPPTVPEEPQRGRDDSRRHPARRAAHAGNPTFAFLEVLSWVQHPFVLFQLLTAAVVACGWCLYERWHRQPS